MPVPNDLIKQVRQGTQQIGAGQPPPPVPEGPGLLQSLLQSVVSGSLINAMDTEEGRARAIQASDIGRSKREAALNNQKLIAFGRYVFQGGEPTEAKITEAMQRYQVNPSEAMQLIDNFTRHRTQKLQQKRTMAQTEDIGAGRSMAKKDLLMRQTQGKRRLGLQEERLRLDREKFKHQKGINRLQQIAAGSGDGVLNKTAANEYYKTLASLARQSHNTLNDPMSSEEQKSKALEMLQAYDRKMESLIKNPPNVTDISQLNKLYEKLFGGMEEKKDMDTGGPPIIETAKKQLKKGAALGEQILGGIGERASEGIGFLGNIPGSLSGWLSNLNQKNRGKHDLVSLVTELTEMPGGSDIAKQIMQNKNLSLDQKMEAVKQAISAIPPNMQSNF
jgi:hypothetical protein